MTPYGMSRRSAVGGGIFLLLYEVFGVYGIESIPKMTLFAIAFMTGIHLKLLPQFYTPVYLSPVDVMNGNLIGVLLGPIFHVDDLHLYYNMASLIWKGRKLEQSYGSLNFALLLLVLTAGSSFTFVGLSYLAADFFEDSSYIYTKAIGFSGVLFALKVITGERNSMAFSTWAELIIVQLAVPNASLIGHLSGLLFGICYVFNPFSFLVTSVQKSFSKYHLLSVVITLLGFHYNDSHSSPLFNTIKNFFSYSDTLCINSRTQYWSYFITSPLKYKDQMDYLLLFISFPIKLSLIESFRGVSKAWVSVFVSFLGTSVIYYLGCCYLRLEKLPFLQEECAYGLSGPLFALKTANICIMLFGGPDYAHLIFELIEACFLLMNEAYNLYHLSGAFVGLLLFGWLRSQERRFGFRGRGVRLGRREDSPPVHVRSSRATRSWGYGDYDRSSVVRRREKRRHNENEQKVIKESLQTFYEEKEARRREATPSAPPEPTYPSLDDPPPPPSFNAYSSIIPTAPSEEEVMDIDEYTEMELYPNDDTLDTVREKRIHKFG